MNLFYAPGIASSIHTLSQEESHHCLKVMRLKRGDTLHLTDGRGSIFTGVIIDDSKACTVEITGTVFSPAEWQGQRRPASQERSLVKGKQQAASESLPAAFGYRPYRLHLAVAPTKHIDRFEWLLEKATEIGVDEITPLLCEHSERKQLRTDRLEKVITSAVKQSIKAWHPVLNGMMAFGDFVAEKREGQLFIAHLAEDARPLKESYIPPSNVTILIGPEGDFDEKELQRAAAAAYQACTLGSGRLRTETAAVVAVHTISLLNSL